MQFLKKLRGVFSLLHNTAETYSVASLKQEDVERIAHALKDCLVEQEQPMPSQSTSSEQALLRAPSKAWPKVAVVQVNPAPSCAYPSSNALPANEAVLSTSYPASNQGQNFEVLATELNPLNSLDAEYLLLRNMFDLARQLTKMLPCGLPTDMLLNFKLRCQPLSLGMRSRLLELMRNNMLYSAAQVQLCNELISLLQGDKLASTTPLTQESSFANAHYCESARGEGDSVAAHSVTAQMVAPDLSHAMLNATPATSLTASTSMPAQTNPRLVPPPASTASAPAHGQSNKALTAVHAVCQPSIEQELNPVSTAEVLAYTLAQPCKLAHESLSLLNNHQDLKPSISMGLSTAPAHDTALHNQSHSITGVSDKVLSASTLQVATVMSAAEAKSILGTVGTESSASTAISSVTAQAEVSQGQQLASVGQGVEATLLQAGLEPRSFMAEQRASSANQCALVSGQNVSSADQSTSSASQSALLSEQTVSSVDQTVSSAGQNALLSNQSALLSEQTALVSEQAILATAVAELGAHSNSLSVTSTQRAPSSSPESISVMPAMGNAATVVTHTQEALTHTPDPQLLTVAGASQLSTAQGANAAPSLTRQVVQGAMPNSTPNISKTRVERSVPLASTEAAVTKLEPHSVPSKISKFTPAQLAAASDHLRQQEILKEQSLAYAQYIQRHHSFQFFVGQEVARLVESGAWVLLSSSPQELFEENLGLIGILRRLGHIPDLDYRQTIEPILVTAAKNCLMLPASFNHHDAERNGLFKHALNVAVQAIDRFMAFAHEGNINPNLFLMDRGFNDVLKAQMHWDSFAGMFSQYDRGNWMQKLASMESKELHDSFNYDQADLDLRSKSAIKLFAANFKPLLKFQERNIERVNPTIACFWKSYLPKYSDTLIFPELDSEPDWDVEGLQCTKEELALRRQRANIFASLLAVPRLEVRQFNYCLEQSCAQRHQSILEFAVKEQALRNYNLEYEKLFIHSLNVGFQNDSFDELAKLLVVCDEMSVDAGKNPLFMHSINQRCQGYLRRVRDELLDNHPYLNGQQIVFLMQVLFIYLAMIHDLGKAGSDYYVFAHNGEQFLPEHSTLFSFVQRTGTPFIFLYPADEHRDEHGQVDLLMHLNFAKECYNSYSLLNHYFDITGILADESHPAQCFMTQMDICASVQSENRPVSLHLIQEAVLKCVIRAHMLTKIFLNPQGDAVVYNREALFKGLAYVPLSQYMQYQQVQQAQATKTQAKSQSQASVGAQNLAQAHMAQGLGQSFTQGATQAHVGNQSSAQAHIGSQAFAQAKTIGEDINAQPATSLDVDEYADARYMSLAQLIKYDYAKLPPIVKATYATNGTFNHLDFAQYIKVDLLTGKCLNRLEHAWQMLPDYAEFMSETYNNGFTQALHGQVASFLKQLLCGGMPLSNFQVLRRGLNTLYADIYATPHDLIIALNSPTLIKMGLILSECCQGKLSHQYSMLSSFKWFRELLELGVSQTVSHGGTNNLYKVRMAQDWIIVYGIDFEISSFELSTELGCIEYERINVQDSLIQSLLSIFQVAGRKILKKYLLAKNLQQDWDFASNTTTAQVQSHTLVAHYVQAPIDVNWQQALVLSNNSLHYFSGYTYYLSLMPLSRIQVHFNLQSFSPAQLHNFQVKGKGDMQGMGLTGQAQPAMHEKAGADVVHMSSGNTEQASSQGSVVASKLNANSQIGQADGVQGHVGEALRQGHASEAVRQGHVAQTRVQEAGAQSKVEQGSSQDQAEAISVAQVSERLQQLQASMEALQALLKVQPNSSGLQASLAHLQAEIMRCQQELIPSMLQVNMGNSILVHAAMFYRKFTQLYPWGNNLAYQYPRLGAEQLNFKLGATLDKGQLSTSEFTSSSLGAVAYQSLGYALIGSDMNAQVMLNDELPQLREG